MSDTNPSSGMKKKLKSLRLAGPLRWLRELIAISVWVAGLTHLLVFDVGTYISQVYPNLGWILRFRFLIILGAIGILWLFLGNRKFATFFGYIIFYPFVFVFWIVPRLAFRNWPVLIAFSPAIYSIVRTFRVSFFLFATALISAFVIYFAEQKLLIVACMMALGFYLIAHYVRRFKIAFSPSTVFGDIGNSIRKLWDFIADHHLVKEPVALEPSSEEYQKEFGQNLLTMYMFTTGLHYLGERLREVVNSRKLDIYFLGSLLYTFALTAVVFSIEYFGLERITPGSFVGVVNPTLLDFLGYSFGTLMTAEISQLRPANGFAEAGTYLQLFGSLLIVILLVFVILTSIRERYNRDLDKVISELGNASDRLGSRLEANYTLTLAETEIFLLKINPEAMKWLLKIRHGEDEANKITQHFEGELTDESK